MSLQETMDQPWSSNENERIVDSAVGLKVCRPLSVTVIRLPTSTINKFTSRTSTKVEKKKIKKSGVKSRYYWKRGCEDRENQRRRKNRERRRKVLLQMSNAETESKDETIKEDKTVTSEKDVEILNSHELEKESPKKFNGSHENEESNINQSLPEAEKSELPSSEDVIILPVKSQNELPHETVNNTEKNVRKDLAQSSEKIPDISSRKNILRHATSKDDENERVARSKAKRKRLSESCNDDTAQESSKLLHESKRSKSANNVEDSNDKTSHEDTNIALITKEVEKSKKHHPKSVRRRNNLEKEARVVVERLENQQDPLTLQWKEKMRLKYENRTNETPNTTSPIDEGDLLKSRSYGKLDEKPEDSTNNTAIPATTAVPKLNTSSNEESKISVEQKTPEKRKKSSKGGNRRTEYYDDDDEEIAEFFDNMSSYSSYSQRSTKTTSLRRSARLHSRMGFNIDSSSDSEETAEKMRLRKHDKTDESTSKTSPMDVEDVLKSLSVATEENSRQRSPVKIASTLPTINDEKPEGSANNTAIPATTAVPNSKTSSNEESKSSVEHKTPDKPKRSSKSAIQKTEYYDDDTDEEITEFLEKTKVDNSPSSQQSRKPSSLRRSRRLHSRMGFNIDSSSDSDETIVSTRLLRSHTKTPSIRSSPERKRPETRMSRMLGNTFIKNNSDSEDSNRQYGIPKSSSSQGHANSNVELVSSNAEFTGSPSSHRNPIRCSIDSTTSESSIHLPMSRKKSARRLIEDSSSESNFKPGEALTDIYDEDLSSPMPTQDDNTIKITENFDNHQKTPENSTEKISTEKTENFLNSHNIHENNRRVETMIEDSTSSDIGDSSDSANPPSSNRSDAVERKKLPVLNAMVFLTRLEDLADIYHSDEYSDATMDLRNDDDWPWSSNADRIETNASNGQTEDPLDINKEANETSGRDSPIVASISGPTRTSPRKIVRLNRVVYDESDTRWSQDTAESDVELTLRLEDGDGDGDDQISQSQSTEILSFCENSACKVSSGVVCSCEAGRQIKQQINRLLCQTASKIHKCVICNRRFDDQESLDKHKTTSLVCGEFRCDTCEVIFKTPWGLSKHKTCCPSRVISCVACDSVFDNQESLEKHKASNIDCAELRCSSCQITYKTTWGLSKHRPVCSTKLKSKEKSTDETMSNEADTDSQTEHNSTIGSTTSSKKKKSNKTNKKLPKKKRNSAHSDNTTCNVCSQNFDTKQALSEHIYKHSQEELQEAFRIQKAKMMTESQEARSTTEKNDDKSVDNEDVDFSSTANVVEVRRSSRINNEDTERIIWTNATNSNVVATTNNDPTMANVCQCHRENHGNIDKNELQIEMVLVCQYCKVLFRRRECFEVHYRTSPCCANNRMQGRLTKLFCANCQLTLHNWDDMRRHLEVHARLNPEGTVRFVCNICRVVFIGFGALFYYHWGNHTKDPMFVASRYSFPKNSVQPIDGQAKLPIGASPQEIYVWVAEHVCAECKKPFPTREDLFRHRETDTCRAKVATVETTNDPVDAHDSQWYCDVCNIVFADRDKLNDHGVDRHGRHYTCVSTSPRNKTFMCTKCCAMRKKIKEIEEHWKTHPKHNLCRFDMETNTVMNEDEDSNAAIITPVGKENQPIENSMLQNGEQVGEILLAEISAMNTNDKAEKSVETTKKRSEKITESIDVFHTAEENSDSQINNCTENRESSIARATVIEAAKETNGPSVCNLLTKTSMILDSIEKSTAKQKTRFGALEDPCVNVVLSGSSSPALSASLIIDESPDKISDESVDDIDTPSYQILKMDSNPKSSSGPIKMVFGRKTSSNSEKKSRRNESSDKISDDRDSGKKSASKTKTVSNANENAVEESQLNKTLLNNSTGEIVDKTKKKAVDNASKTSIDNAANSLIPAPINNHHEEPEIIDIIEEIEMPCENIQIQTNENSSATSKIPSTKSLTQGKIPRNKKVAVFKLHKNGKKKSSPGNSGSEMNTSANDNGKYDNLDASRREPFLSFEESRYAARLLAEKNARIAAASNKQGFLRVKNISELQAVKKYSCLLCNASFESTTLLDEHRQQHFNSNLMQIPKGISVALKLPDSPESPKAPIVTPATKNLKILPTQSFIPQRQPKMNSATNVNGANVTTGVSWNSTDNQKTPLSNSLLNGSNVMNPLISTYNSNVSVAKSVITSTASIAQQQQNFANQAQPLNSTVNYTADIHRQLPETRNTGQIGHHVLPAMVIPQSNRQQATAIPQHNSSINNLPTNGMTGVSPLTQNQSENLNKFVCEVCSNFESDTIDALNEHVTTHLVGFNDLNVPQKNTQPTISTVIVPQSSSFTTTFNEVLPNNTTVGNKSTSDRFVVNNWILRNSSIVGWPTPSFNQQTAPPVLPINTQPLLTSTVTNPNGNSRNSDKTSSGWSTSTWNPPISTSVGTIDKQSHSTMATPRLNINNNSTNASRQQRGWSASSFENTAEILGGQIVYQCTLCKSAMYSDYEHLRRHVLTVHDDEHLTRYRIDNYVQRHYYCTRCPNGAPPFDTALKLASHQNTDHLNVCPVCQRVFHNYVFLNDHVLHCQANNGHDFDSNY